MSRLIASGDSFIFGTDLADATAIGHSLQTWPSLIANHFKLEYTCSAIAGSSNSGMARRAMLACEENKQNIGLVVVQWTYTNRYELKFAYHPWHSNVPPHDQKWVDFNSTDIDFKNNQYEKDHDPTAFKFIKEFYKNVGHDDVFEAYTTLKEIVFLQNYLITNRIPFLFTTAYNFFISLPTDANITALLNQIKFNNWFFFDQAFGFVQWAKMNNYPKKLGHPLEQAHLDAYNIIKDTLNEKDIFLHKIGNK
jgi:hypothetical protein